MATKKTSSRADRETHVTRIHAASASAAADTAPSPKPTRQKQRRGLGGIARPFVAIGGYFKGAWRELGEVRWPTRRQTWSMTGALVGFTAVFVVLILLLDALFEYLFNLILK